MPTAFTLLDDGQAHQLDAVIAGNLVTLTPASVQARLGWKLTDDGLCQGAVCIPTRGYGNRLGHDGLELTALAAALDRPLAVDVAAGGAALGTSVGERAARLRGLTAPDLRLNDLDGQPRRLDEFRPRKVFLLAFASW